MRKVLLIVLLLGFAPAVFAQNLAGPLPITANAVCVPAAIGLSPSATIQVTGTYVGTLTFSISGDGGTFVTALMINETSGATATTTTSTGMFSKSNTGFAFLRACSTAWTSGTAQVTIVAGRAGGGGAAASGGGGSGTSDTTEATQLLVLGAVDGLEGYVDGLEASSTLIASAIFGEDVTHTGGDKGIMPLCVRRATTPADMSSGATAGDYEPCQVDANGRVYQNSSIYTPAGDSAMDDTLNTVVVSNATAANFLVTTTSDDQQAEDNSVAYALTLPTVISLNYCDSGAAFVRCPIGTGGAGTIDSSTSRITIATDDPVNDALVKLDAAIVVEDAPETAAANLVGIGTVRRDVAAPSATTAGDNATLNTDALGLAWTRGLDPCSGIAKTTDPFSLTARGVIIAAVSAKKNYICSISVVAGAAEIFNIDEGTGTTCQTGTAAIVGSTTAGNGQSFAANGGAAYIGGNSTVLAGKTANVDTCIVPSSTNRLSGFVTYVQAP